MKSGPSRTFVPLIAALMAIAVGPGCTYLAERGRDFVDILGLGVSDGGGLAARVAPTRLLTVEVGARKDETFYGIRRSKFHWVESSYGIPFAFFWSSLIGDGPIPDWTGTNVIRTSDSKLIFPDFEKSRPRDVPVERRAYHLFVLTESRGCPLIRELDLQVDASLLIAGLQIIVSPGELVDFLAGIFTLDPGGDDAGR